MNDTHPQSSGFIPAPFDYVRRKRGGKFPLGMILVTPELVEKLPLQELIELVHRHAHGREWVDLGFANSIQHRCEMIKARNSSVPQALTSLFAVAGVQVKLSTSADRTLTHISTLSRT